VLPSNLKTSETAAFEPIFVTTVITNASGLPVAATAVAATVVTTAAATVAVVDDEQEEPPERQLASTCTDGILNSTACCAAECGKSPFCGILPLDSFIVPFQLFHAASLLGLHKQHCACFHMCV
jgi:hypothetical protein